ncbi:MAG: EamA family transporter, partial [Proteobacteria bacterium]|nr:EamA family transporter [Pseudomonadota bacterium]
YLIYGVIGAILQLSSFLALFLGVPVAIVAMLINTQPIWTTIFGRYFLGERVEKRQIIAMVIALIGVIILLEPWTATRWGQMTGILLSLTAGFSLSLWIIWGRRGGLNIQHGVTITFGFIASTLAMLLLCYPLVKCFSADERIIRLSFDLQANQWYFLIIFVLVTTLIPHLLFFNSIRYVKVVTAGILLLLEPLSAALLAVIIFAQPLTPFMALGGAIILGSNYFIIKRGKE